MTIMIVASILMLLTLIHWTSSVNRQPPAKPNIVTGFWYGESRGPKTDYDTLPFARMTVKINRPNQDGPGQNLMKDPFDLTKILYVGNTINRQTFDTQFVLDMSYALQIDSHRIFVTFVKKGDVHFSWESTNVIVQFVILERNYTTVGGLTLLESIASLTQKVQDTSSTIYQGTNVTCDIDPTWGVVVDSWDTSLKLSYAIEVVGGSSVESGYYLNQGGLGLCDYIGNNMTAHISQYHQYCEFERFFEDDVSRALNITYYRVQILFVKKAALDSVIVHFRINPPMHVGDNLNAIHERDIASAIGDLHVQVHDYNSLLYKGNVTIRVDPIWGVDDNYPKKRTNATLFTQKYYTYDPSRLSSPSRMTLMTAYDRCKANRRCNWGIVEHNQTTNDVRYFQRLYDFGQLYGVNLFLDFEDWRTGSRGFSWTGVIPPTAPGASSITRARALEGTIRGAHFSPFDQRSLGPDIPCYLKERNQGLVLDRSLQRKQIDQQSALVDDLQGRVAWLGENIEWATMDATLRARKDVRMNLTWVQADFQEWTTNEEKELAELDSSQCVERACTIMFNTSSLKLIGAINDTGVIRKTSFGTEVAVFTFNSIYLGPEVKVVLVGQRALSLVSKTTAIINTTFHADPGTLGGFQGGGSVARLVTEALNDHPRPIYICDLGGYCNTQTANASLAKHQFFNATLNKVKSNNVNGPGSGNLRVTPFVIKTSANTASEIQVVQTSAQEGQTLAGSFTLHFRGYTTPPIPFDASADHLKQIMEDNLNLVPTSNYPVLPDRVGQGVAGIGVVQISRSKPTDAYGFTWSITFVNAIGNIEQMTVTSFLTGLKADVTIKTAQEGNEIGGFFTLSFHGAITPPISSRISAAGLEKILLQLPHVSTAMVIRNDPTENCDDGMCPNGPYLARGLLWTVFVTTDVHADNLTPMSPTSPLISQEAPHFRFTADTRMLTGLDATVAIYWGSEMSDDAMFSQLTVKNPFSLAYGGAGASYGGLGGAGYSVNPIGYTYNSERLDDLLGGSGGCMRGVQPYAINAVKGPPTGTGGHGGGAMEIIASNDIVIGDFGVLSMRGGDAEQSPEGGGGGGSGGAIMLAAGGTVVNYGTLDVTGGGGGFGGISQAGLDGGGGGGGRIAIYAESITMLGQAVVAGGPCGLAKNLIAERVTLFNITVQLGIRDAVDFGRLAYLGAVFVNSTIATEFVTTLSVHNTHRRQDISTPYGPSSLSVIQVELAVTISNDATGMSSEAIWTQITASFAKARGTSIAEVYLLQVAVDGAYQQSKIDTISTTATSCTNKGSDGTLFTEATMTTSMYVGNTNAAENTTRALFFSNNENTNTSSGSFYEAPFSWNGPVMPFEASRPTRVSYYTRLDAVEGESKKANFGALFSLLSRGEPGINVSSVIGVFTGDSIMYGANFGSAVDEKVFLKRTVVAWPYPTFDRWFKVDIHISWENQTYNILLDDNLVALNAPFSANDVDGIRISLTRAVNVWFDEIYVGFDNMMGFQCPSTTRQGTSTAAPPQKHWSYAEVHGGGSGYTLYNDMTRHYSHMEDANNVKLDGQGAVRENQDIKLLFPDGDYPITQGKLHAGALVYLTNSLRSAKTPNTASETLVSPNGLWYAPKDGPGGAGDGRQFWYTEYDTADNSIPSMNGGVAACSSQDLVQWRFEGFVFQYANISDMVYGTEGPFVVERPKVKFNPVTKNYVMWAVMDNAQRSLAMNLIATSPYEDGPFLFRRSFYPDGNQTRDQVIFVNDVGQAVLGRTYYQTVEYLLPESMMQPVWESVKFRNGSTDYRTNYHRAFYANNYDNYHDIFNQRWRKEDIPWNVTCYNKITGASRQVAAGEYNALGTVCNDPEEEKRVYGQGNPVATSRFVSPASPENSWWLASSVPAVMAQPWSSNYRDGYCGIRKLDEDMTMDDPNLAHFTPQDRGKCSNIADNPIHVSKQDKMIGVQRVVTSRRAKYMAISELTEDFLDTTGYLNAFEGELESGDLISMIIEMGQFGFGPGGSFGSTFAPPGRSDFETANDYSYRFKQYIRNHNDRGSYALACVIDGVCPVNYKNQTLL